MIIIKRKPNISPLKWISNPVIRRAFPIEQDIFELYDMDGWTYLEPYFDIIDTPGANRENKDKMAPCWKRNKNEVKESAELNVVSSNSEEVQDL
jgi:hypothetical protein